MRYQISRESGRGIVAALLVASFMAPLLFGIVPVAHAKKGKHGHEKDAHHSSADAHKQKAKKEAYSSHGHHEHHHEHSHDHTEVDEEERMTVKERAMHSMQRMYADSVYLVKRLWLLDGLITDFSRR